MISPKKLIKMVRKWQKLALTNRKRISLPRANEGVHKANCSTFSVGEKGHFVVYTADQIRFVIPLAYLKNNIIIELFKMAEDVFGLPSDLIQRKAAKDVGKALLMSLATGHCLPSSNVIQDQLSQQSLICSF